MKAINIPSKFPIPFANAAGGSYIRNIPEASQIGITDGAASLTDGFPPLNFLPVASGGVPPFGQDFNGLMKLVTQWIQWTNNAGVPVGYDSSFQTSIGGYPKGAFLLQAAVQGKFWISTADDNVTDPDTGGAGWMAFPIETSIVHYGADVGTANAIKCTTLSPGIPSLIDGMMVVVNIANGVTASSTLELYDQTGATLGAKSIIHPNGLGTISGDAPAQMRAVFIYDLTRNSFQLANAPANAPTAVYLRCTGNGTQTFADNTKTLVNDWTVAESALGDSTFSGGVLTIGAKTAGLWQFAANLGIGANASNWISKPDFEKNGAAPAFAHSEFSIATEVATGNGPVSGYIRLAAGDTVAAYYTQNTGSTQTASGLNNMFGARIAA